MEFFLQQYATTSWRLSLNPATLVQHFRCVSNLNATGSIFSELFFHMVSMLWTNWHQLYPLPYVILHFFKPQSSGFSVGDTWCLIQPVNHPSRYWLLSHTMLPHPPPQDFYLFQRIPAGLGDTQSADEEVPKAFRNCSTEGLVNFYSPLSLPDCVSFPWQPEPTSGTPPLMTSLICCHDATNASSGRGMPFVDIWVSSVICDPVTPSDACTVLNALPSLNTLSEPMLTQINGVTRPQWVLFYMQCFMMYTHTTCTPRSNPACRLAHIKGFYGNQLFTGHKHCYYLYVL